MLQPIEELENWHKQEDPWGYESSHEDTKRKEILLSELPEKEYTNVLDVGCGQGFITRDLPGRTIIGVDISLEAIKKARPYENQRIKFKQSSIFELNNLLTETYDLVIITGVLYPQYVGNSLNLVYRIIDDLLADGGILVSVHIDSWYKARFPYLTLKDYYYPYREHTHKLEIYVK